MHHFQRAKSVIQANPESPSSKVLSALVRSLAHDEDFEVSSLYNLSADEFDLAMHVIQDWRLDRYYMGKAKVFDLASNSSLHGH